MKQFLFPLLFALFLIIPAIGYILFQGNYGNIYDYYLTVYAKYKDKGVKVVLVSLDFPEHVNKAVLPFIEKNKPKSEAVLLDDLDANAWIPKVSPEWSGAIPATLVIKDGERHFYEQSFTYESLENEIQSLL